MGILGFERNKGWGNYHYPWAKNFADVDDLWEKYAEDQETKTMNSRFMITPFAALPPGSVVIAYVRDNEAHKPKNSSGSSRIIVGNMVWF